MQVFQGGQRAWQWQQEPQQQQQQSQQLIPIASTIAPLNETPLEAETNQIDQTIVQSQCTYIASPAFAAGYSRRYTDGRSGWSISADSVQ